MNRSSANTAALVAGGLMYGFTLLAATRNPKQFGKGKVYKQLWAIGLLTIGLGVAADVVPEVAGPFAVLILLALAVQHRGQLGGLIGAPAGARGPVGTGAGGFAGSSTSGLV